jgi:hypothetical protein
MELSFSLYAFQMILCHLTQSLEMSEGLKKTEQLTVISKSQLDKHFMDSM